jgi:hypothetical protein
MSEPLSIGVGIPFSSLTQADPYLRRPRISSRPYVRLEICASRVKDCKEDEGRVYNFVTGLGLERLTGVPEEKSSVLMMNGNSYAGRGCLVRCLAQDAMTGQSGSVSLAMNEITKHLAEKIRTMDRMRLVLRHPLVPDREWLLFDGPIKSARLSRQAGSGFSNTLNLQAGGLPMILGGATFNWQGFVHPSADLLRGVVGTTLYERMCKSALPTHLLVKEFIQATILQTMAIYLGDWKRATGIPIDEYVQFSEKFWHSIDNAALPIPWPILQQQTGQSFWTLVQRIAEPFLHEIFCGYELRAGDSLEHPVLIHRPLPFPGMGPGSEIDRDGEWRALPVYRVGYDAPSFDMVEEEISMAQAPTVIHWAPSGAADHSKQIAESKLLYGYMLSESLIQRYGFHSVAVTSRVAPIAPGTDPQDAVKWSKRCLEHYGRQFLPLSLMRSRQYAAPFIPIRPGQVFEDWSAGATMERCVTGYCTGSSFSLSASRDGIQMRSDIQVERCIWGTDAANYPDAHRALVSDIRFQEYAGPQTSAQPPVMTDLAPPLPEGKTPRKVQDAATKYEDDIKAAAKRSGIPAWVIAHVLTNESQMGTYLNSNADKGIAQLVNAAQQLVANGYHNPDGSLWKIADRGDPKKSIYACAEYLRWGMDQLQAPALASGDKWSYVVRTYRWGANGTNIFGNANNWTFPGTDASEEDFRRYWSPDGMGKGLQRWGYLSEQVG